MNLGYYERGFRTSYRAPSLISVKVDEQHTSVMNLPHEAEEVDSVKIMGPLQSLASARQKRKDGSHDGSIHDENGQDTRNLFRLG